MEASSSSAPRARQIALPSRGGVVAGIEFGSPDRPVDVIFSHANGFNALTYRSILEPLGERLRILAIDMRGHGASSVPAVIEGRKGWPEFRDDLLAVIEAVADQPVVLSGHSMGGTASVLAAAADPARVRALALFDPVFVDDLHAAQPSPDNPLASGAERRRASFPSKAAALAAYTGRGAFRSWTHAQLADYVEAGFRETPGGDVTLTCAPAWESSNFRTHNVDARSALLSLNCPVHILRAAIGSTARIDNWADDLAAKPTIGVETVPDTTHFLPMERPDRVRDTLLALAT